MRREILLSGSGGQGIITASIILAEAAALHEGLHVVQSQAYGPEARGGASSAHVILNDIPVGYPKVVQPQVLVCLTQAALDRFGPQVRPGGLLLTDRHFMKTSPRLDARMVSLPMFEEVKARIGMPITFNICVLGALVELTGLVRPESVRAVIAHRVPARFLPANEQAFELGRELARG